MEEKKTYFGFQPVSLKEKQSKVQKVFSEVASKYDIMNDLMSGGLHRIWKNSLINMIAPQKDHILLDLAGGTGDVATRFLAKGGKKAVVCDLNPEMLEIGRKKSIDNNKYWDQLEWVHGNAEGLPFADNQFDYCSISFGIRNVSNIQKALKEIYRVLKPAGKFVCLEFSPAQDLKIAPLYDFYSFKVIPKIGQLVAEHADHYQYLVESIKKFPTPNRFAQMIEKAGFGRVDFKKICFGVVAIHSGYKESILKGLL